MPEIYAFRAVQYHGGRGDVSTVVAPPYDVLDKASKAALVVGDARNVVSIDLPHTPAKELGPPEAYHRAAELYRTWLADGVLTRCETPAIFAYRQTFAFMGKEFSRCGVTCTVETTPFGRRAGGGILPHEQTFSGPKEDRLALMKATQAQLSPIFGLHPDRAGTASKLARQWMSQRPADMTAKTADGTKHEVWKITDATAIADYRESLRGEDVFIADGHHRYTTALNYLRHLEDAGAVSPDHPARRCMMVLVGMSDPGLAIGPTHRVLGGMSGYTFEAFIKAAAQYLKITLIEGDASAIEPAMAQAGKRATNVFGLYDVATGRCAIATLAINDPLAKRFADKPRAWRNLDVAIIQHIIVEEICRPALNDGKDVTWAFPHSVAEVLDIAKGGETGAGGGSGFAQLAVIVRPTPLDAVREVSEAGELMPQKSTFFYPKLATGLFINPLA